MGLMGVYTDCRHYVMQTVNGDEKLERCRLGANEQIPFACPDGCIFFEPRNVSGTGWHVGPGGSGPGGSGPGGSGPDSDR
jgi:hypothetical protein